MLSVPMPTRFVLPLLAQPFPEPDTPEADRWAPPLRKEALLLGYNGASRGGEEIRIQR